MGTKISELTAATDTNITGADQIPVVDSGVTKRATVKQVRGHVSTIAALRGITGEDGDAVQVLEDGKEGIFVYSTASTAADNEGTVVKPSAAGSTGRWLRKCTGAAQVNWFGTGTSAWNAAIALMNAGTEKSWTADPGTYTVGKLTEITASGIALDLSGVVLKSEADALSVAGDNLLKVSGNNARIINIEIDGNQSAYTTAAGSALFMLTGSGHDINGAKIYGSPSKGFVTYATKSAFRGMEITDNANLGAEIIQGAHLDFVACSFDRNGYGFKKTRTNPADTSHDFAAFGMAIRMRSHHITIVGCSGNDNGKDGLNVNQGSYAVKFIGCTALRNDDGGLTIASDNTGSGLPGEGEACYDVELADCEAANNYSSGLAVYQPAHNITVRGGRYYNNHRLAGNLTTASSYRNGIYIAAGSTGINIDTKAYDERQTRVISGVSGGTLTATGWVPGTYTNYPKVAIYAGADRSFRGYGTITAESAGSVTITPTTYNGVTLAAILVGDYVGQSVQHSGVFFDNNCQGVASADGFGHKKGPGDSGHLIFSGSHANGQNVHVGGSEKSELLANGSFDAGITDWTFSLTGGGAATHQLVSSVRSLGGLKLVGGSTPAQGDATLVSGAGNAVAGGFVRAGVWCYADAAGDATLYLFYDNGGYKATIVRHPGGGWRYLSIGAYIPSTGLIFRLESAAGKTTYWDSASLKEVAIKTDDREFAPVSRSLAE